MERERRQLPRMIYRLRLLGLSLGGIAIAAVLLERQAGWPEWAWLAFTALAWPQLAYLVAMRSRDPYRAELRNLLLDSALAGAWVPLMHFNLLTSSTLGSRLKGISGTHAPACAETRRRLRSSAR